MSFTKLYVHAIWSTKRRLRLMDHQGRVQLCKHIFLESKKSNIHIISINGEPDHIHTLIRLVAQPKYCFDYETN